MKLQASYGPVFLRIGLGLIFLIHGAQKWMGMDQTIGFFGQEGIPMASFTAYAVAGLEVLIGVAFILGLFTSVAAGVAVAIMAGAILFVNGSKGFAGGYEYDLLILLTAASLLFTGPGALKVPIGKG
ncbi:DoxX family protein [Laceyella tengchongensis]|jgi:putative oxidoreductase|uniref:DoxX family protein n=1 Tax=Laceyella tengchongensis TaxID=574699 RepID=UPI0012B7A72B|nr:DoxX family membrane protein [Laceyella tengchongensis]